MSREPFVPWSQMLRGDDVPAAVAEAARGVEAEQVQRAIGRSEPAVVRAYSYTFLACLVHDVNLVHGALDRLGMRGAVEPLAAAAWADGDAASFTARLPGGAIWHCAWLLLRGLMDFRERAALYFADAIHELELPVPYWPAAERVHRLTGVRDGEHAVTVDAHLGDAYVAELRHFHACVVDGIACRTPPEQALRDIELLRDLFVLTRPLI
jgi:predicted dehydrogenase